MGLTSCGVQHQGLWRTRGYVTRPWNQDIGVVAAGSMLFTPPSLACAGARIGMRYCPLTFRCVEPASYHVVRVCMHRLCLDAAGIVRDLHDNMKSLTPGRQDDD